MEHLTLQTTRPGWLGTTKTSTEALKAGQYNGIQLQDGAAYRVLNSDSALQSNVIASQSGDNLIFTFSDGTQVNFKNYFLPEKEGGTEGVQVFVPSDSGELAIDTDIMRIAIYSNNSGVILAHGDDAILSEMLQSNETNRASWDANTANTVPFNSAPNTGGRGAAGGGGGNNPDTIKLPVTPGDGNPGGGNGNPGGGQDGEDGGNGNPGEDGEDGQDGEDGEGPAPEPKPEPKPPSIPPGELPGNPIKDPFVGIDPIDVGKPQDDYVGIPRDELDTGKPTDDFIGIDPIDVGKPQDDFIGIDPIGGKPGDGFIGIDPIGGKPSDPYVGIPRDEEGKPGDGFIGIDPIGGKPTDDYIGIPRDELPGKPDDGFIGIDPIGGKPTDDYVGIPRDESGKPTDDYIGIPRDEEGKPEDGFIGIDPIGVGEPTEGNAPPTTNSDFVDVNYGETYQSDFSVLDNDSDREGDPLTVVAGTFETTFGGTVTFREDGTFDYQAPDSAHNFDGRDWVMYEASDGTYTTEGLLTFYLTEPEPQPSIIDNAVVVLDETDAVLTVTGQLTSVDPDGPDNSFNEIYIVGNIGSLIFFANGGWLFTANSAFNELNVGDSVNEVFNITSIDGTPGTVQITINGTNDAAVITGDGSATLTETDIALRTSGKLTIRDIDNSDDVFTPDTVRGQYGIFQINKAGIWTFTANSAFNELNVGDSHTEKFRVETEDGTRSMVTITIEGTNDAAVITGDDNAILTETDVPLTANGKLISTDVDNGNNIFTAATIVGTTGAFSIDAAGAWTFKANSAFDELNVGESINEIFNVTSIDGTPSTVTVTIEGTNDAAVVSSANIVLDETDEALIATGTLTSTDVDNADNAFMPETITGQYGTLVIDAAGAWVFTANSAFDELNVGDSYTDNFKVHTADGTETTIDIVIKGTDDYIGIPGGELPGDPQDPGYPKPDPKPPGIPEGELPGNPQYPLPDPVDPPVDPEYPPVDPPEDPDPEDPVDPIDPPEEPKPEPKPPGIPEGELPGDPQDPGLPKPDPEEPSIPPGELPGDPQYPEPEPEPNNAPDAGPDHFSANYGETYQPDWSVLDNDSDPDGDTLTVIAGTFETAYGGTVIMAADGTFEYQAPDAAAPDGRDWVLYEVTDGEAITQQWLTFHLSEANQAPIVIDDSVELVGGAPFTSVVSVLANDSDADGDTLRVWAGAIRTSWGGTVVFSEDGHYVYTSPPNFRGVDSVFYDVLDDQGGITRATLELNVIASNEAPVAVEDIGVLDGAYGDVIALDLLANDSDPDGHELTIIRINTIDVTGNEQTITVIRGEVYFDGQGGMFFKPADRDAGQSSSFQYTISDGYGGTSTAIAKGTIQEPNYDPVAVNDIGVLDAAHGGVIELDLLANDTDQNGDPLTITHINQHAITGNEQTIIVARGSVYLDGQGGMFFEVDERFNVGESTYFEYTISDGRGGTDTAMARGTIREPEAVDDVGILDGVIGDHTRIDLLANDIDNGSLRITHVNGVRLTGGVQLISYQDNGWDGAIGSITINSYGNMYFDVYQQSGYYGPVSFEYTITDGNGNNSTATASGTIRQSDNAPVANDDLNILDGAGRTPILIDLLANDSDVDPIDTIRISHINGEAWDGHTTTVFYISPYGTVTLYENGATYYEPMPSSNYTGPVSFEYTITDGKGRFDSATAGGSIDPAPELRPVANDDHILDMLGIWPLRDLDLLGNDTTDEYVGSDIYVSHINGVEVTGRIQWFDLEDGQVHIKPGGSINWYPYDGVRGPVGFEYTITDAHGHTSTARVYGTIYPWSPDEAQALEAEPEAQPAPDPLPVIAEAQPDIIDISSLAVNPYEANEPVDIPKASDVLTFGNGSNDLLTLVAALPVPENSQPAASAQAPNDSEVSYDVNMYEAYTPVADDNELQETYVA